MRKPAFCICENKDADQLHGNHKADQRLCFRYIDSTNPLLPIYKISRLVGNLKTGFLTTRLKYGSCHENDLLYDYMYLSNKIDSIQFSLHICAV